MSKLRNILIIICQILVIVLSAFLLTQPFFADTKNAPQSEEIIVIDASVNMMASQLQIEGIDENDEDETYYDATRFERAINEASVLGNQAFDNNKRVTVIMAGTTAQYLEFDQDIMVDGVDTTVTQTILHCSNRAVFNTALSTLIEKDEAGTVVNMACDYTGSDMHGAIELVDELTSGNAGAMVTIFTGTEYTSDSTDTYKGKNGERDKFRIVNIAKSDPTEYGANKEWNAAILGCSSIRGAEGGFEFNVDVASYNNDLDIPVFLEIYGADGGNETQVYKDVSMLMAKCREGEVYKLRFVVPIRSFISARIYINENDSLSYDNTFYHYCAGKNVVKVIYVSPAQSNQYGSLMQSFAMLSNQWDFSFTTTTLAALKDAEENEGTKIVDGGYDLYIFEYEMPDEFPTDGIVVMVSPETEPTGMDLAFGELVNKISEDNSKCVLSSAAYSPLMKYVEPTDLLANQFRKLTSYDGYKVLMTATDLDEKPCPAYLVNEARKIALINFPSVYADLSVRNDFAVIYYNMIKSWLPATMAGYSFDVNKTIEYWQSEDILAEYLPQMQLTHSDGVIIANDVDSYYLRHQKPGRYTITQKMMSGKEIYETYYVKIPKDESNFIRKIKLSSITIPPLEIDDPKDLFIYVAIALIVIVFAERLLHVKGGL